MEQKLKEDANMLKIMQVPLIKYIIEIVKSGVFMEPKKYNDIFKLPPLHEQYNEPLVLLVDGDYVRLDFLLEPVILGYENSDIKGNLSNQRQEMIMGIIKQSANYTLEYIIQNYIIDENIKNFLQNIHFEIDTRSFALLPICIDVNRRKLAFVSESIEKINTFINDKKQEPAYHFLTFSDLDEKEKENINNNLRELQQQFDKYNELCSDIKDEEYKNITNQLLKLPLLILNYENNKSIPPECVRHYVR